MKTPGLHIEPRPIEWLMLLLQVAVFGIALAMALITRERSAVIDRLAETQAQVIRNQETVMSALERIEAKQRDETGADE